MPTTAPAGVWDVERTLPLPRLPLNAMVLSTSVLGGDATWPFSSFKEKKPPPPETANFFSKGTTCPNKEQKEKQKNEKQGAKEGEHTKQKEDNTWEPFQATRAKIWLTWLASTCIKGLTDIYIYIYIYIYEVQISKDAFLGENKTPAARYLRHKKLDSFRKRLLG